MFKNRQALGALCPQRDLTFNIGDLKFCDLAKLWFFKLIMTDSNIKNNIVMITIMTPKKCHQNNVTKFFQSGPPNQNF